MTFLYSAPFVLQGCSMFFDEFYFHRKRGLPLWERIGHPVDTLAFLLCFAYLIFAGPEQFDGGIYLGLAVFSSLLITKDEFVHKKACSGAEHWLHSVLFILHPVVLFSAYRIRQEHFRTGSVADLPWILVCGQFVLIILFMLFQIVYWNFSRGRGGAGVPGVQR